MLEYSRKNIDMCKKKIKNNNRKIKELSYQANEYEAIMEVIAKTDISGQMLATYQQKLNNCLSKIDRFVEDNKNNHDLISVMKVADRIIKNNNK